MGESSGFFLMVPCTLCPVSYCFVFAVLAAEALGLRPMCIHRRDQEQRDPGRWWQQSREKQKQQTLDSKEEKGYSCQSGSKDSGNHTGWKLGHRPPAA